MDGLLGTLWQDKNMAGFSGSNSRTARAMRASSGIATERFTRMASSLF
jgi:hypothetical protein